MRPGHKARLLTSDLRGSSSPQCLIFYYNMYGSGMGILSVLLRRGDREEDTLLWRRRGEQSISWMRAMVDYDCDVRHQVRGTQTVCKHVKHLNVKHVKLKHVTLKLNIFRLMSPTTAVVCQSHLSFAMTSHCLPSLAYVCHN